jgi:hypothetical protein
MSSTENESINKNNWNNDSSSDQKGETIKIMNQYIVDV